MGMGQVPTRMGMRRVEVLDAFTKVDCSDQETVNGATLSGPHTGTTAGHRSNIFEMRKIDHPPLGACQGRGPWLRFGFRNAVFPSWFPWRCRLSPLFYEGAQILFFPPP
jgi:hypothetical protein